MAQSGLMLLVLVLGPMSPGHWRSAWIWPTAVGCLVLGAFFGSAGAWVLGRNRTIFPRPHPRSHLVQEGVYGWVRHPLYTSVILLAVSWSLFWGSWASLAVAVGLAVFLHFKSIREETWLTERFPEYAAYRKRVRRFVPWLY